MSRAQVVQKKAFIDFIKASAVRIRNSFIYDDPQVAAYMRFGGADREDALIPDIQILDMPILNDIPTQTQMLIDPISELFSGINLIPDALPLDLPPANWQQNEIIQQKENQALLPSTPAISAESSDIKVKEVLGVINQITGLEPKEIKSLPAGAIKITLTTPQPEYAEVWHG
ncbi:MAG: hypothetical protein U5L00_07210 [Desulfovermiculus sp.]|nr:hypothetical protein [Desulfovermiculus sp.]